jgi:hypothetical protein
VRLSHDPAERIEYDEWYTGDGVFAQRDRPGWGQEVSALVDLVSDLSGSQLAEELGGEVLLDGRWFVAARAR